MKASEIITSYDLSGQSVKLSCRRLGHVFHAYRCQAQRAIEALEQTLHDLGLSENLVEIEGRLRSQHKLLDKIDRGNVSRAFWLLHALRVVSRARLGHALALAPARGASAPLLAQAAEAPGVGCPRSHLALCPRKKSSHPEPLAVDLGLG